MREASQPAVVLCCVSDCCLRRAGCASSCKSTPRVRKMRISARVELWALCLSPAQHFCIFMCTLLVAQLLMVLRLRCTRAPHQNPKKGCSSKLKFSCLHNFISWFRKRGENSKSVTNLARHEFSAQSPWPNICDESILASRFQLKIDFAAHGSRGFFVCGRWK